MYRQLRDIARAQMRGQPPDHTLQATALAHEAYARLAMRGMAPIGDASFMFAAARAMRDILVESARARQRAKRSVAGRRPERLPPDLPADLIELESSDPDGSMTIALDRALRCLERDEPDLAAIVRLRFFAGLSGERAAQVLAVSPRQVDRLWSYARARLFGLLKREIL